MTAAQPAHRETRPDVRFAPAVQESGSTADRPCGRRVHKRERTPPDQSAVVDGLTRDEDDELRRLHYFSNIGALAGQRFERFLELRLRDRRKDVRVPREFEMPGAREAEPKPEGQAPRPHPNLWLRGKSIPRPEA